MPPPMSGFSNGSSAKGPSCGRNGDAKLPPNSAIIMEKKPISAKSTMAAQSNDDPVAIIRESTSVAEIQAGLASLHVREVSLTSKLDALLASQSDLSRSLSGLDNLRAGVGTQAIACRAINNGMLSGAADTASRLSGRVRALDLEKQRVEDTLKVVEQVAELKACVAGVAGSMGTLQDWEAAAGYIARAAKIPEEIIRSEFAAAVVPTVEVPDPPWVTLESARESLCGLFLREFERAVSENDGVRVTRFFKLFPLIGRADVGLDVYGRYVCQGVAAQARAVLREPPNAAGGGQLRKDNFFFANALNKLFEHIAQIVNSHGALVERHYGAGKMVKVIERLQMEADVQGGIILDSWSDERNIDRKLTDTKSYPFSFLVNSFLLQQRGLTGTPRVNSPAMGSGTNTETRNNEDQGVDMKEIDALLSEIAVMLSRWSLYSRFLAAQCRDPDTPSDAPLTIPHVLEKSSLYQKVSARLISPYNTMTTFFFRRSVEKAFQLDETPTGLSLNPSKPIEGNPPFIISAVDDVMYVLSAVIQKSISTCQRDVLGFVIPNIGRVLGSDFIIMIQRKMKDESYPRAAVQGGLPPEDKIISFIVLINSLDVANEYLARIVSNHLGPSSTQARAGLQPNSLKESFPFDHDLVMVTNSLNALNTTFSAKSTELMNDGLQVLFNQLVRYRLRSMLTETFRDVDYTLTEEELAEIARQNDEDEDQLLEQVPRRFQHGWESLMKPLSRIMTPKTFGWLLDMTARHLARVLERRLWGYAGRTTAYGAIRMERDFTGIVSAVAKGNYGLREAFARTTQLLMVANMEEEEWEELNAAPGEDGIEWMLSEEERARARKLVRA